MVESNTVIVDVDFTEHFEHFEGVVYAVDLGWCSGGEVVIASGGGGVGFGWFWVGECVGDFECSSVDVEAEESPSDEVGEGLLAVLDYFEDGLCERVCECVWRDGRFDFDLVF